MSTYQTAGRGSLKYLLLFFLLCFTAGAESEYPQEKFIGIQIGAGYSRVGVMQNGTLKVLTNHQGVPYTPSHVVYTDHGFLVGKAAMNHPGPNLFEAVVDMNRLFNVTSNTTTSGDQVPRNLSYKLIPHPKSPKILFETSNGTTLSFKPEQIYAPLLAEMRKVAESHIGVNTTGAVTTMPPSYYDDQAREIIEKAGKLINLPIMRQVRESVSVGLAYGLDHPYDLSWGYDREEIDVIVYDLGSRYLDVSYMVVEDGMFDTIATRRVEIGGDDFDFRVAEYLAARYRDEYGLDLSAYLDAVDRLMPEVERAKQALSSDTSSLIEIDDFYDGRAFSEVLTREKFEEINMDLIRSTLPYLDQVLEEGKIPDELEFVILAGGSSRIPIIQEILQDYFPGVEVSKIPNTEEAGVWGAALQSKVMEGQDGVMVQCACASQYWEEMGDEMHAVGGV